MWKRQERGLQAGHTGSGPPTPRSRHKPDDRLTPVTHAGTTNIGQSVIIKGEFTSSEDLVIDGLERANALRKHLLTIGPDARIQANVSARSVVVVGPAHSSLAATDKTEIRENGTVYSASDDR